MAVIVDEDVLPPLNIKVDWLKDAKHIELFSRPQNVKGKIAFTRFGHKALIQNFEIDQYDFVYIHGPQCSKAAEIAFSKGVPSGQRIYGSFVDDWLKNKGRIWTYIRHFPEVEALKTKKSFLLSTHDGSNAWGGIEAVCKAAPPFDFYEWDNGVDRPPLGMLTRPNHLAANKPYLFYGSRIQEWKNQHLAIELLNELKKQGVDCNLVFAGANHDQAYFDRMQEMISSFEVEKDVFFLGSIPQKDIFAWHKNALATLFLYDVSNRGSSFLEAACLGSNIVVPDKDSSVADLVRDGYTGITFTNPTDCAKKIATNFYDAKTVELFQTRLILMTDKMIPSWDERIQKELELIDSYVDM